MSMEFLSVAFKLGDINLSENDVCFFPGRIKLLIIS